VAYRHIGSNYAGLRVRNMHNAAVLYIATRPYFNVIDIATHDCIVPNRAVCAEAHVSHYTRT